MNKSNPLENDLLLRVALGQPVERPPIWIMRQAGRYLRSYLAVREKAGSFRNMIANPAYAAEVTLQPIDQLGVDAAIIFSDILVIPEAIGLPYQMVAGEGPVFPKFINTKGDIDQLHPVDQENSNLDHTYKAIELVKEQLNGRVPLIGFAGAPWTIFCYMTEGKGSKSFSKSRGIIYRDPEMAHRLLEIITEATITYLKGQIRAGVDIIQLFDSWAGLLDLHTFATFSLPYIQRICDAITDVPKIVYAKGAFFALEQLAELEEAQVIGLDWHTPPNMAAEIVQNKALQGNLDPAQLYASVTDIEKAARNMLIQFPPGRHIVNLGHGVFPDMPVDGVKAFIQTVKSFTYASS